MLKDPDSLTRAEFVCAVFWLNGKLKTDEIAERINRTTKKKPWLPTHVRKFADNGFVKARQSMTIEERQAALTALSGMRRDFGVLTSKMEDRWFTAAPIPNRGGGKRVSAEPVFDLNTRAGRRAKRAYDERQRIAAAKREMGYAERGPDAAPIQYLFNHGLLAERGMSESERIATSKRRWNAAEKFAQYCEGARLSSFGALDYERATMGSSGGQRLALPAHKIFCIDSLNAIRSLLTGHEFAILEAIVDRQEMVWAKAPQFDDGEGDEKSRKREESRERQRYYRLVRYLLDAVSVHERWLTREDFKTLWKTDIPEPTVPTRAGARTINEKMEELMRAA